MSEYMSKQSYRSYLMPTHNQVGAFEWLFLMSYAHYATNETGRFRMFPIKYGCRVAGLLLFKKIAKKIIAEK